MTEYISKEEILKIVRSVMCDTKISHKHRAINRNVKQIPAADIEPIRHGHWIVKQTALGQTYTVCSNCEHDPIVVINGHFTLIDFTGAPRCLNCGAVMDEKENENDK